MAPVLTAAADQSSDEGQDVAFDLGSFSDAGANDADWTVDIDWGDSSSDTFDAASQGALGALNHTYADNGLYSVEVCVTDKDLATTARPFEITVANVAPTIALSGDASVDEGCPLQPDPRGLTDPGDDTVTEWTRATAGDGGSGDLPRRRRGDPHLCRRSGRLHHQRRPLDEDDTHLDCRQPRRARRQRQAPISLSGPATADEGDTETYSFVVSDPGA